MGPTTGPMQIVEEEALRQDNPADPGHPTYACCKAITASAVFTPNANAITTVPVNFHVKQDLAPEASATTSTSTSPSRSSTPTCRSRPAPIPTPASASGSPPGSGQERAGSYGTAGAMILFNADWEPAGGGGGGGTRP